MAPRKPMIEGASRLVEMLRYESGRQTAKDYGLLERWSLVGGQRLGEQTNRGIPGLTVADQGRPQQTI